MANRILLKATEMANRILLKATKTSILLLVDAAVTQFGHMLSIISKEFNSYMYIDLHELKT